MKHDKHKIGDWKRYYQDIGLPVELSDKYIRYIKRMYKAKLPVIFEFQHLASLLGRKTFYLASVVNSSENHYRTFKIPKRIGGIREISAPYPALLECQKWINKNTRSKIYFEVSIFEDLIFINRNYSSLPTKKLGSLQTLVSCN